MNTWQNPWFNLLKFPLSGNVDNISPVTRFLSPTVEVNYAGDQQLESEIVGEVASFGRQLGILSDAILELADDNVGDGVEKLRTLAKEIDEVKEKSKASLKARVMADLKSLEATDKEGFDEVIGEYR